MENRGGHVVTYYQWAPLLLLVQAFLFRVPFLVWQTFGDNSGIDVGDFITAGQHVAMVPMEGVIEKNLLNKMVRQIDRLASSILETVSQSIRDKC